MEVKVSPKKDSGFSEQEKAAMKERAKELKAAEKADKDRAAGESDLLAKIAEMAEADREIATQIHRIVSTTAPDLWPKTWYGMPAYAREGKVVCFFQSGQKFSTRYCTFGFQDSAHLDEGAIWPTSYAITKMTPEVERKIESLLKQAIS